MLQGDCDGRAQGWAGTAWTRFPTCDRLVNIILRDRHPDADACSVTLESFRRILDALTARRGKEELARRTCGS
jgi:hypothetical protein